MRAEDVLKGAEFAVLCGDICREVTSVVDDSRKASKDSMFICLKGAHSDGHIYMNEAIIRGASVIAVTDPEAQATSLATDAGVLVIRLVHGRRDIGLLCSNFYGRPSEKLTVIGITGTKGKTTAAYMLKAILESCGKMTGLIGTIETDDCRTRVPSKNTTPGTLYIHRKLADMVSNGADCCVMEISSQGLMKGRTSGILFDVGVFTNLSPDHIGKNEHATFEEYERWKESLFASCRAAVINADDMYSDSFAKAAKRAGIPVFYYGLSHKMSRVCDAEVRSAFVGAANIRANMCGSVMGLTYELVYRQRGGTDTFTNVFVGIPGQFNAYNSLAAVAAGVCVGIPCESACRALADVKIRGRLEPVKVSGSFSVIIDYAHNAVSLKNVLTTLRQYKPRRVICLFGCGGNRARDRRSGMGTVSGAMADLTVITSDNPRYEQPEAIMADIEKGVRSVNGHYIKIVDRKEAIRYALTHAECGDVVLLSGKGHETYQEISGRRLYMDERNLIQEIMEEDAGAICGCNCGYIP